MATCGYLCPACEGKGYDEEGNYCDWCVQKDDLVLKTSQNTEEKDLKEWIDEVHNRCCGDL